MSGAEQALTCEHCLAPWSEAMRSMLQDQLAKHANDTEVFAVKILCTTCLHVLSGTMRIRRTADDG